MVYLLKVELEEIASKDYQNYFIINIDRNSIENITLEGLTFIKLEVPANSEQLNKKIITIVNTIKKYTNPPND